MRHPTSPPDRQSTKDDYAAHSSLLVAGTWIKAWVMRAAGFLYALQIGAALSFTPRYISRR